MRMGLSQVALSFIITGSIALLVCGIGLLYAYLYYTQMKPRADQLEREYYKSHPQPKKQLMKRGVLSREPFKRDRRTLSQKEREDPLSCFVESDNTDYNERGMEA